MKMLFAMNSLFKRIFAEIDTRFKEAGLDI